MYKVIILFCLFLSLTISAQAKEFITSFDDSTYKHAGVSFGLGAFADTFAYHAVEQWDTKERIIYCGLIGSTPGLFKETFMDSVFDLGDMGTNLVFSFVGTDVSELINSKISKSRNELVLLSMTEKEIQIAFVKEW